MVKLDRIVLLVVLFTFLLIIDKPVYAAKKISSTTTTVLPEVNGENNVGILAPMPVAILNAPSKGCPPGQRMDRGRCRSIIQ